MGWRRVAPGGACRVQAEDEAGEERREREKSFRREGGCSGEPTWEWVTMPVTDDGEQRGRTGPSGRGHHSLAAEDDSPTVMQEEMPGLKR